MFRMGKAIRKAFNGSNLQQKTRVKNINISIIILTKWGVCPCPLASS